MFSLIKKIESLREQPKAVRNRFALTVAFFFTFIVVGVWGLAMTDKVASIGSSSENTIVTISTPSRWWGTLSDLSANFKANVIGGRDQEVVTDDTLDIEALSKPPTVEKMATSSGGVWQQPYSGSTSGRRVLIATTTNATSSTIESQ